MSNFVTNDLLRRKLQTGLTIITLTLSIASTLFLLLFSSRLGFNVSASTGTLTQGLTSIFSEFTIFIGVLIFVIGAVLTSFITFLMMAQRTKDYGLIKAAGCPNNLVAGYFMTELLTITITGCVLGVFFGFLMDYVATNFVFSGYTLPNFWFAPVVFAAFFGLAMIFGLRPIIKASKMSPAKALSPIEYYGLTVASKRKPISKLGLTWRIASRSLYRRQTASIRLIILLSTVFILLTVSIAGGIIASDTTTAWIQNTVNSNTIAVATTDMGNQYEQLLAKFSGTSINDDFNYSDPKLAIPQSVINRLSSLPSVSLIDTRLVLKEHVQEISNFTVDYETQITYAVGDSRQGDAIVIGVNPDKLAGSWFAQGRFLNKNDGLAAVVGDSLANELYSPDRSKGISIANALVEGIAFQNDTFNIVGICVDPVNNGFVTYVPIGTLMNVTGISSPNLLLIQLNNSSDASAATSQIRTLIQSIDPSLNVFPIQSVVQKDSSFLASNWGTIMILPIFSLASAALCLIGYIMLVADEQHQEFAILRAVGAKPRFIVSVLSIQSIVLLLSSFGIGILIGTIITVIVLMQQPLVTSFAMLQIIGLLFTALAGMFILSLYPAVRLAKVSILKIMT